MAPWSIKGQNGPGGHEELTASAEFGAFKRAMLNCHWTTWEERYGKIWQKDVGHDHIISHDIFEKNLIFSVGGDLFDSFTQIFTLYSR